MTQSHFAIMIVAVLFSASCGVAPPPTDEQSSSVVAVPEANASLLSEKMAAFDEDLAAGDYGLIDEVRVEHKGKEIFHFTYDRQYKDIVDLTVIENSPFSYAHPDWHPYYRDTDLHTVQSITKSITAILIGILEDQGKLPPVEEALLFDHISDTYQKQIDDIGWSTMTIADLLTMRTGIEWDEESYSSDENDTVILETQIDDWVQYTLDKPLVSPPSEIWQYNSGATQLLSAVIEQKAGMSVSEFAAEHLFKPLGITVHYWKETPAGLNDTLGGLYLRSTDLTKFCMLMASGGLWNEKRVLSESFATRALTNVLSKPPREAYRGYGYKWWLGYNLLRSDNFRASGYGDQGLTCIPEQDLSIVIYSWNVPELNRPDLMRNTGDAIADIHTRLEDEIFPLLSE